MSKRSKNKRLKKQKKKNAMRIINNNVNNTSTDIQSNDNLYNATINYISNNRQKQEQETILMGTQTVKSSATKSKSAKTASIKTSAAKTSVGKIQPTVAELINNNRQQNAISHLKVSARRTTSASRSANTSYTRSINAKPKTIPLYVRIAMDLYVNQMPIADVAKKYNRTRQQIYWLNAKSIKHRLPEIWNFGHQQTSKLRLTAEAPRYMQIATSLLNNESIDDIAKKYNKTTSYVKRIISTSIKDKIPCMYKLIKSRGI